MKKHVLMRTHKWGITNEDILMKKNTKKDVLMRTHKWGHTNENILMKNTNKDITNKNT